MSRQIIRPYLTSSAVFNGSNTVVTSGINTGITGNASFSMAALININTTTNGAIMGFGGHTSTNGVFLNSLDGFSFESSDGNYLLAASKPLGWVEVCGTFSGAPTGTATIYINGSNVGSAPGLTFTISNSPLYIGEFIYYSRGNINDVRLWNVCLSAATVSNMWFTGNIPYLGQSQLVRRYILNDGTGSTPKDSSVNNDTATSSNLTWSNNTFMKPRPIISVPRKLISVPRKLITTKRLVA